MIDFIVLRFFFGKTKQGAAFIDFFNKTNQAELLKVEIKWYSF